MNMMSKRSIITIVIWILINVRHMSAECNACLAALQIACVSPTQYQFCTNDIPSGAINSCPTNYVCSTATTTFCQPLGTITPTCTSATSGCNVCDPTLTFACTGTNTYALCLGSTIPSTIRNSCGTNLVCNINNAQICGNPLAGITASCPSSVKPTIPSITTPSTLPSYAQYLCTIIGINARFALPAEYDNTCKKYIYCFRTTSGTWSGQIYTCAGATNFDPYSRYCVANRPTFC